MKTYTVICDRETGMLIDCIPDGADVLAAIRKAAIDADVPEYPIETCSILHGLTLTNDASEVDALDVLYSGHTMGSLTDETGQAYEYAVVRRDRPTVGRPVEMDGGRRVQVYLDAPSIAKAETLGDGNVSAGIRAALAATE